MWKWAVIGWTVLQLCVAAPPQHINRLALFPDKSAWCEAKNITQIIGHPGCQPLSMQNRACLGQCFSYSVPNTFPQQTESLVHCDSCMPVQMQWEVVTLECPGNKEMPYVDKLVERILQCSCQSCNKEAGQEGALLQLFPLDATLEPPARSNDGRTHGRPASHTQHAHADSHPHPHRPAGGRGSRKGAVILLFVFVLFLFLLILFSLKTKTHCILLIEPSLDFAKLKHF